MYPIASMKLRQLEKRTEFDYSEFREMDHAVMTRNFDEVKEILREVKFRPSKMGEFLKSALKNNDYKMTKFILSYKSTIFPYHLIDIIWMAIFQVSEKIARILVKYGMNEGKYASYHFYTILHAAIEKSSEADIRMLLKYDINVNAPDYTNCTPLHYAIRKNELDIARLLVRHGADINRCNGSLISVLHQAVNTGCTSTVKFALDVGADVKAITGTKKNVLHVAAEILEENLEIGKMLIEHGAVVDQADVRGQTPLHMAIITRKEQLVELFLEKGADVHRRTNPGYFALYLAVEFGTERIVEMIIAKKARINERTLTGVTALHSACKEGKYKKIKILLKHGADINIFNPYISPPLVWLVYPSVQIQILIAKHVARLMFDRSYVHERNLYVMCIYDRWIDYYKLCVLELYKMMTVKVYHQISFYYVLITCTDGLLPLMHCKDFVEAYWAADRHQLFPLYVEDLDEHFKEAETKHNQLQLIHEYLISVYDQKWPTLDFKKIMNIE